MKKFVLMLLVLVGTTCVQAADLKIGYVDMKRLLTEAPQVAVINDKMQQQFSKPRDDLKKWMEQIKDKEKGIKKNEMILTDSQIRDQKQKLVEEYGKFKDAEAKLGQDLQKFQREHMAGFEKQVRQVLDELAKEEKYQLIVGDAVLYADDSLNITDNVLKRLGNMKH